MIIYQVWCKPIPNLMDDGISTARLCGWRTPTSLNTSVSSRMTRKVRGVVVCFNSLFDMTLSTPFRYLRSGLPTVAEHAITWRSG